MGDAAATPRLTVYFSATKYSFVLWILGEVAQALVMSLRELLSSSEARLELTLALRLHT